MSLSDTADALLESLPAAERDATLLSAQAMCEEHDPVTLALLLVITLRRTGERQWRRT